MPPDDAITRRDLDIRDMALDRIEKQQDDMTERLEVHDANVRVLVHAAVDEAVTRLESSQLTSEERTWVRMAVVAAGKKAERWEAIVRHGTIVLIFGTLALIGQAAWALVADWLRAHGLKI